MVLKEIRWEKIDWISLAQERVISVAYRGGVWGVKPPPKITKVLQNRAKINPIVKNVKNC